MIPLLLPVVAAAAPGDGARVSASPSACSGCTPSPTAAAGGPTAGLTQPGPLHDGLGLLRGDATVRVEPLAVVHLLVRLVVGGRGYSYAAAVVVVARVLYVGHHVGHGSSVVAAAGGLLLWFTAATAPSFLAPAAAILGRVGVRVVDEWLMIELVIVGLMMLKKRGAAVHFCFGLQRSRVVRIVVVMVVVGGG